MPRWVQKLPVSPQPVIRGAEAAGLAFSGCSWSVHGCVPTLLVVGWERKHAVLPVSLLLPMKTCKEAFLPT